VYLRDRASDPISYLRLTAGGTIVDTLSAPTFDFPVPLLTATAPGTSGGRRVVLPFAPSPIVVLSPHGYFITGIPNRYSFELLRPRPGAAVWRTGDPVMSVRRLSVPSIAVTREEASDYQKSITSFMRAIDASWSWRGPSIPQRKPAFRRIFVGDDGRIWIGLHTTAELNRAVNISSTSNLVEATNRWIEPGIFDVFEVDGRYLGQVRFPRDIEPYRARGDTVIAITVDGDGFQSVRRFRLLWK